MYLSWCFYSKYENGKFVYFFEKSHITDQTEDDKRKFMSVKKQALRRACTYMIILC